MREKRVIGAWVPAGLHIAKGKRWRNPLRKNEGRFQSVDMLNIQYALECWDKSLSAYLSYTLSLYNLLLPPETGHAFMAITTYFVVSYSSRSYIGKHFSSDSNATLAQSLYLTACSEEILLRSRDLYRLLCRWRLEIATSLHPNGIGSTIYVPVSGELRETGWGKSWLYCVSC